MELSLSQVYKAALKPAVCRHNYWSASKVSSSHTSLSVPPIPFKIFFWNKNTHKIIAVYQPATANLHAVQVKYLIICCGHAIVLFGNVEQKCTEADGQKRQSRFHEKRIQTIFFYICIYVCSVVHECLLCQQQVSTLHMLATTMRTTTNLIIIRKKHIHFFEIKLADTRYRK